MVYEDPTVRAAAGTHQRNDNDNDNNKRITTGDSGIDYPIGTSIPSRDHGEYDSVKCRVGIAQETFLPVPHSSSYQWLIRDPNPPMAYPVVAAVDVCR